MKDLGAIILAAGVGKRMRSKLAKVLHPVGGRPMVLYSVELAGRVATQGVSVVVGYQHDTVRALIESSRPKGADVRIVVQAEQLGTGHAVMQARRAVSAKAPAGAYLILNGDTPLLSEDTVRELLQRHEDEQAVVTVLTAVLPDPRGYGRVVRPPGADRDGAIQRIVEDRDASEADARLNEVNVGTYVVNGQFLFEALDKLEPQNAQGEYYLTDIIELAVSQGLRVCAMRTRTAEEGLGINTRRQLAAAERALRDRIRARWMEAGVTLLDPASTFIDWDVTIGRDTVIHPNVALEGRTSIGEDCTIRSHCRLTDTSLGRNVTVLDSCVMRESRLEDGAVIGPFAHLRPGSVLRRAAKVGNFVEMKKTELGEGSKANHLTYLGDARIGKGVNIGAGTITCNYDGFGKYETVIEDGVFIGSDVQLVAPVKVGRGALIGAGTTVTTDVPPDALAIGRANQVNRPGWAARRRAMLADESRQALGVKREAKVRKHLTPDAVRLTKKGSPASRKQKTSKGRSKG